MYWNECSPTSTLGMTLSRQIAVIYPMHRGQDYWNPSLSEGMKPFLEHLNITSTDVDETLRFLMTAMPSSQLEGREEARRLSVGPRGDRGILLVRRGQGRHGEGPHKPYVHPGMNHMGFVVDDAAALANRLIEAGYEQGATYTDHPHRHRYYFFDHDRNEYEFVQYLSEDPSRGTSTRAP